VNIASCILALAFVAILTTREAAWYIISVSVSLSDGNLGKP